MIWGDLSSRMSSHLYYPPQCWAKCLLSMSIHCHIDIGLLFRFISKSHDRYEVTPLVELRGLLIKRNPTFAKVYNLNTL